MKFKVRIKETLERVVEVDAENACEAEEKVNELWNNEKIILTADDFTEADFTAENVK